MLRNPNTPVAAPLVDEGGIDYHQCRTIVLPPSRIPWMSSVPNLLLLHPEIEAALADRRPVVALESTLIAHGLPWPVNLDTARAAEEAVRAAGAVPATIAVLAGRPTIGLTPAQLERLGREGNVRKAGRRDLAAAVAQKADAATTVSATMALAHRAGIAVFATGGIGGVHRGSPWDVSADLLELARTPVLVVCAGAKSILDLPATLEVLETQGVPVLGYRTDTFPAFYLTSSGLPVSARVESAEEAAEVAARHWQLGGAGLALACPLPPEAALQEQEFAGALRRAEELAEQSGVRGPALTPFLLARVAELTEGRSLRANQVLIVANARLAGEVAAALGERAICGCW
jgi:pseudouridine-5'-phosphate glycosidase